MADYISLLDFLQARLDEKLYEDKLGLMHQVELDFKELSDGLTIWPTDDEEVLAMKRGLFPRGRPRVILYIDDLDRCPPERVVEVLEAVQLLLKTQLFIIVLALDTRYATRSLEKYYKEILYHDGDPSGLDYIEKIIGIPYRVQPMTPDGLDTFLKMQMEVLEEEGAGTPLPVTGEDGQFDTKAVLDLPDPSQESIPTKTRSPQDELPTHVVKFLLEDRLDLKTCCEQIGLTPRSVKRLINVFKLIEVYWFRTLGKNQPRSVKQAMIGLLALSAGYPEIMREAFAEIETRYRDPAKAEDTNMAEFLYSFTQELEQRMHAGLLNRYQHDVCALGGIQIEEDGEIVPSAIFNITLKKFGQPTFHLVRSFCFVGDPSYIAEDGDDDEPPDSGQAKGI